MYRAFIAVAAFSFASAPQAFAGNAKGIGLAPCHEVWMDFQQSDDNTRAVIVNSMVSWTQGYMTGKNAELDRAKQRDLQAINGDLVLTMIGAVCTDYPDAPIYAIADVVFEQLEFAYGPEV